MNCNEFLDRHSEFLDDRLSAVEAAAFGAHMQRCTSCARYDSVVRRGAQLFRQLPPVEPGRDLISAVHRRAEVASIAPARNFTALWLLASAAVLAAIVWSPVARRAVETLDRPGVEPAAAMLADFDPAVAPELYVAAPAAIHVATRPVRIRATTALNIGPYSPLIVQPPAFEAAPPPRRVVWEAAASLP